MKTFVIGIICIEHVEFMPLVLFWVRSWLPKRPAKYLDVGAFHSLGSATAGRRAMSKLDSSRVCGAVCFCCSWKWFNFMAIHSAPSARSRHRNLAQLAAGRLADRLPCQLTKKSRRHAMHSPIRPFAADAPTRKRKGNPVGEKHSSS